MHLSIILMAFTMTGAFCMPTALNLTDIIKPRENTYGVTAVLTLPLNLCQLSNSIS